MKNRNSIAKEIARELRSGNMITATKEHFMKALRGIPARAIALAMNEQHPGINYIGCSKQVMSEHYERSHRSPDLNYPALDLDLIKERASK